MPVTPEPALLQDKIEEFLTYCGARNLSPNTLKAYCNDFADFAEYAGAQVGIADLNRKLIRGFMVYLHDKSVSRSSIGRKLAAIKSLCKWMAGEGMIEPSLLGGI